MNIMLSLHKANLSSSESVQEWWIVSQTERGPLKKPEFNKSGLEIYIFSDQVSPPSLGFLAGYG